MWYALPEELVAHIFDIFLHGLTRCDYEYEFEFRSVVLRLCKVRALSKARAAELLHELCTRTLRIEHHKRERARLMMRAHNDTNTPNLGYMIPLEEKDKAISYLWRVMVDDSTVAARFRGTKYVASLFDEETRSHHKKIQEVIDRREAEAFINRMRRR